MWVDAEPHASEAYVFCLEKDILCCGRAVLDPEAGILLPLQVPAYDDSQRCLFQHLRVRVYLRDSLHHFAVCDDNELPWLFVASRRSRHGCLEQSGYQCLGHWLGRVLPNASPVADRVHECLLDAASAHPCRVIGGYTKSIGDSRAFAKNHFLGVDVPRICGLAVIRQTRRLLAGGLCHLVNVPCEDTPASVLGPVCLFSP